MKFTCGAGELWLGDALELMRDIPDNSIDLIVTDPPYRCISGGSNRSPGNPSGILTKNDGKIFEHNGIKFSDYMPELYRVLKPGTHCYVMVNNLNLRELLNVAEIIGFGMHNLLVWKKNNCVTNRWYMKNAEYTAFLYKKPAKQINSPGSKQVHKFDNLRGNRRHPTEKPLELMRFYIENSSQPGEMVLDPFAGSGTTILAAHASGRRSIGIEIDLNYYLESCKRLSHETGCN